jgi:hypothetical protein
VTRENTLMPLTFKVLTTWYSMLTIAHRDIPGYCGSQNSIKFGTEAWHWTLFRTILFQSINAKLMIYSNLYSFLSRLYVFMSLEEIFYIQLTNYVKRLSTPLRRKILNYLMKALVNLAQARTSPIPWKFV